MNASEDSCGEHMHASGHACEVDSLSAVVAEWARSFFSQRSRVAAALEFAGGLAFASSLPLRSWSCSTFAVLIVASAVAGLVACVRLTVGPRLPRWSLQVDVALGNLLVTLVVLVGAREQIGLANVYLLVEIFALLYFSLRAAVAHIALAGAAYALVLALGPPPVEPRVTAWLAVFGTAIILGAVVLGLASVLRVAAQEDPLTGLPNRRSFDERIDEEVERCRYSGGVLSVAMLDIDGFKAVNDQAGHAAGDQLLRRIARSWKSVVCGDGDLLARIGGDEFSLIAPGSDDAEVRLLSQRLKEALPEGISVSIGLATWDGRESAAELLRRADRQMYLTKRHVGLPLFPFFESGRRQDR